MLGHSSVSITLDVYSHVIPGLGDAAATAMEDALGDNSGVGGASGEDIEPRNYVNFREDTKC